MLRLSGGSLLLYVAGTLVETVVVPAIAQTETWIHLGVDCKLHATGWVSVYVDGLPVIAYTGDTSGQASIDRVTFNRSTTGMSWQQYYYFDDVFFDDTAGEAEAAAVPDYRFTLLKANGNGSESALAGSDGDSVDNYLLVDDVPHDSDTTYVEATGVTQRDLYTVETFTLPADHVVRAVHPWAIAKKSDAGVATELSLVSYGGAGETVSAGQDLSSSYRLVSDRQTTAPGGGAWSESAVNASEYGVEGAGTF
jgi:hypothetical protein